MPVKKQRWIFAVVTALAISLMSTSLALAAAPVAQTAPATSITSTTATLNGVVVPNKTATTYYFQYGTSTSYGRQTPSATANGNASKTVSANVTGLTANTTYHYRLVAKSAGNPPSYGNDATFITPAAGTGGNGGAGKNAVSISSIPHAITWGRTAQIAGSVTGPNKAGLTVGLMASPYPYTAGFKPTGATTTTSNTGAYAFTVRPGAITRYEVTVASTPPLTSGAARVGVRVRVVVHVSTLRPFRGQLVKFYGRVTPAHNGRYALIQRRTSTGAWRTVASARLQSAGVVNGVAVSKYARRIRIRYSGTYRVRVNPRDGNHWSGNSATRTERVR